MILFLDFDGVLHPFNRATGPLVLIPQFEKFLRDFPGTDIVISSAWREAYSLRGLRSFFSPDIARRIIDVTPQFDMFAEEFVREAEIRAWLHAAGREEEPWLAMDDMPSLFSPDCCNLVLVDPDTGFDHVTEQELRKRLLESAR
ncbi:hypothetical protein D3870_10790 [Noviherbaspirillum cavernae]|uniref:FCP1 homology domain-containing protein n=1 Tax=Noviherbaspirillum cavernae TaxID=2320862 RepID=A0A418X1V3_9BURK|nr:HAD domain-containing protein [Noviherbaspirillum cavernae]RJG06433.1 hypothetical protein D3870_10790 [Noviherbaspirillum cavernae]